MNFYTIKEYRMEKNRLKDVQGKLAFQQLMVVCKEVYSLIGKTIG